MRDQHGPVASITTTPSRCRVAHCGLTALPWIALCALDLGGALGEIPGDPASEASEEVFDSPADRLAAYPEVRP